MRRLLTAITVLLLGVCHALCTHGGEPLPATELNARIDKIFAGWDSTSSPGGAVVLTDGGEVVLTRCYGLADIEHGIPISPATRFELASVSKPFTAFGVLLLEKTGKLSLKDNIRKYLPELQDYGTPITVADLLHQTSGLSDWNKVLAYAGRSTYEGFRVEDLLQLVARQRMLEFEPGTKWSYSNTNYALLAQIVSGVTGKPFSQWMEENVFQPLGMHDTSFPLDGRHVLPNRANSYYRKPDGELARSFVEGFEIPGPAHAFSTIEDMAKWLDNLRTGNVGGIHIIRKMQEKTVLKTGEESFYGAGLGMGEYRGIRTAGHSGQTGAFKTELLYCPDIEVGVVVLGNERSMRADDVAREVLDVYLGNELKPLPGTTKGTTEGADETLSFDLDPAQYQRFLGGYRLEADPSVLVAVAREGKWLVGAIVGEGLDLFRPIGPSEFENRNRNCRLAFFGKDGVEETVERVQITLRGKEMWATRVQPAGETQATEQYTGFYYSDELEAPYEIVRDSSGLAVRIPGNESRAVFPADTDILAGGIGILTFFRGENGNITGFDFGEPEDLGGRLIRFVRRGDCP